MLNQSGIGNRQVKDDEFKNVGDCEGEDDEFKKVSSEAVHDLARL